jgi:hypothetical protein
MNISRTTGYRVCCSANSFVSCYANTLGRLCSLPKVMMVYDGILQYAFVQKVAPWSGSVALLAFRGSVCLWEICAKGINTEALSVGLCRGNCYMYRVAWGLLA